MKRALVARLAATGMVFLVCGLAASRLSGQAPPPPPPLPVLPAVRPEPPSTPSAPASLTGPWPVFEVASVKKTVTSGAVSMGTRSPGGGRMTLMNLPLRQIMMMAWGYRDYQIIGGPGWLTTDRFTINAKAETNAPRDQLLLMMRSVVVERFKLKYRNEKRELPMYVLTRIRPDGPLGPKLRPSTCVPPVPGRASTPLPPPSPTGIRCGSIMLGSGVLRAGGMPLTTVVSLLGSSVGGTILDRTGLTGNYDIELEFSLGSSLQAAAPGATLPTSVDGPSIFSAVQDLGLKLERRKEPTDVIVIESVEQPDED